MKARKPARVLCVVPVVLLLLSVSIHGSDVNSTSRNGESVPDVHKADAQQHKSCWLAASANALAAANWGIGAVDSDGNTILNPNAQQRADHIYRELTGNYGTSEGGRIMYAMQWWLGNHGRNPADPDFDPDNTWSNYRRYYKGPGGGALTASQHDLLLDAMDNGAYVNVSLLTDIAPGNQRHAMTLVGADRWQSDGFSTWHDSNGNYHDPPGADDECKDFFLGGGGANDRHWGIDSPYDAEHPETMEWYAMVGYVLQEELPFDGGDPLVKPTDAVLNFDVCWHQVIDPNGNVSQQFTVTGEKAGIYTCPNPNPDNDTEPYWQNNSTVVIPNEELPDCTKDLYLLVNYSHQVVFDDDPDIILEDHLCNQYDPDDIRWSMDKEVALLHWELEDQQPPWEKIIFPNDQYKQLSDFELGNGDVLNWNIATECIPEPATLLLLTTGLFSLTTLSRRRR